MSEKAKNSLRLDAADETFHIRSFGRVRGKRLSTRQQFLVDNKLSELEVRSEKLGVNAILEIGFGSGENMIRLAKAHPDATIIGAEPFINGIAALLSKITNDAGAVLPEYKNIRIWPSDVRDLLIDNGQLTVDNYFREIYILHPDPWPKARHEKRRLLSAEFLNMLARHLLPNGEIIIGTDHTDYYNWIMEQARKTNLTAVPRDMDSIETKYQRKNMFGSDKTMYLVLAH